MDNHSSKKGYPGGLPTVQHGLELNHMKSQSSSPIRKLDVNRDLLQVADLIDTAFREQMDPEGQEYLQQVRRAAHNKKLIHWIAGSQEQVSYPLYGYVWEENNRIIGNLSLFPYLHRFQWRYLIANVAVDADHRGKGIGKELTRVGVQHAHDHGAQAAWLQVRDENPIALALYKSIGFVERARRSTWQFNPDKEPAHSSENPGLIRTRKDRDWPMQSIWLDRIYPAEVTWYFQSSNIRFRPGIWQKINGLFTPQTVEHFSAEVNGNLLGVATLEKRNPSNTTLWLASNPDHEENALDVLLNYLTNRIYYNRKITLNYPAGHYDGMISGSGFSKTNTLIWMEKQFY